jgi:osmoprotectant transport system ATP-binding protein
VLDTGRLVQVGTPGELLRTPASDVVAQLMETPQRQARVIDALLEGA